MNDELMKEQGYLDVDLDDIPELVNATPGQHELRILSKPRPKSGESDNGRWSLLNIMLEVVGEQQADRVYHTVFLPSPDQDKRAQDGARRRLRDFCLAFGIPFGNGRLDFNDFVGKTGFANLEISPDEGYGEKAEIRSVVVPR